MNCNIFQQVLLDYVDGQLSQDTVSEIENHLQNCSNCQQKLDEENNIRAILKDLPIKPMSGNFRNRLMDSISDTPSKQSRKGFVAGFSVAIAASIFIWVAAFFVSTDYFTVTEHKEVVAALNQVKHVRLAFQAPADFTDVTLTIELPDHLELEGYSGQKRISWQASLNSGKNILALPVIAKEAKNGEIVAIVSNNEKSKKFRVPVSTFHQDSSKAENLVNLG